MSRLEQEQANSGYDFLKSTLNTPGTNTERAFHYSIQGQDVDDRQSLDNAPHTSSLWNRMVSCFNCFNYHPHGSSSDETAPLLPQGSLNDDDVQPPASWFSRFTGYTSAAASRVKHYLTSPIFCNMPQLPRWQWWCSASLTVQEILPAELFYNVFLVYSVLNAISAFYQGINLDSKWAILATQIAGLATVGTNLLVDLTAVTPAEDAVFAVNLIKNLFKGEWSAPKGFNNSWKAPTFFMVTGLILAFQQLGFAGLGSTDGIALQDLLNSWNIKMSESDQSSLSTGATIYFTVVGTLYYNMFVGKNVPSHVEALINYASWLGNKLLHPIDSLTYLKDHPFSIVDRTARYTTALFDITCNNIYRTVATMYSIYTLNASGVVNLGKDTTKILMLLGAASTVISTLMQRSLRQLNSISPEKYPLPEWTGWKNFLSDFLFNKESAYNILRVLPIALIPLTTDAITPVIPAITAFLIGSCNLYGTYCSITKRNNLIVISSFSETTDLKKYDLPINELAYIISSEGMFSVTVEANDYRTEKLDLTENGLAEIIDNLNVSALQEKLADRDLGLRFIERQLTSTELKNLGTLIETHTDPAAAAHTQNDLPAITPPPSRQSVSASAQRVFEGRSAADTAIKEPTAELTLPASRHAAPSQVSIHSQHESEAGLELELELTETASDLLPVDMAAPAGRLSAAHNYTSISRDEQSDATTISTTAFDPLLAQASPTILSTVSLLPDAAQNVPKDQKQLFAELMESYATKAIENFLTTLNVGSRIAKSIALFEFIQTLVLTALPAMFGLTIPLTAWQINIVWAIVAAAVAKNDFFTYGPNIRESILCIIAKMGLSNSNDSPVKSAEDSLGAWFTNSRPVLAFCSIFTPYQAWSREDVAEKLDARTQTASEDLQGIQFA